jgi:uncharacterized protein YggT (Ycf19 family)
MTNEYNSGRVIQEKVIQTPEHETEKRIEHEETVLLSPHEQRQHNIRRIHRIIYFIVHVISIFILIRFFFVWVGVNPENVFAVFLYGLTAPFLAPFLGLFGNTPPPTYGQNIIEVADLVAIGIYYLFAWIGAKIVVFAYPRPETKEAPEYNTN